jgi:flagellar hook-basal body complex protein FliE
MSISPIAAIGSPLPGQAASLANVAGLASTASLASTANLASATGIAGGLTTSAVTASGATASGTAAKAAPFPDLAGAVDTLQGLSSQADVLAVQAVTGDLDDVHDYTIAATQAAVAVELTAAIRNKAIDAFNEIMRMQA